MDIKLLVNLTSRAWSLKILALIHSGVSARQAPLIVESGAGRTTLTNSLKHLQSLGLLERNPGHGHPLRPEFRLTPTGRLIAPIAAAIDQLVPDNDAAALLRRSWTVPLLAVAGEPKPFTELKRNLGPITDRALSTSLRQLRHQQWMERSVAVDMHPPRPFYRAINEGAKICSVIALPGEHQAFSSRSNRSISHQ